MEGFSGDPVGAWVGGAVGEGVEGFSGDPVGAWVGEAVGEGVPGIIPQFGLVAVDAQGGLLPHLASSSTLA